MIDEKKLLSFALKKLARRQYSVYEMDRLMRYKGYEGKEIETVIKKLLSLGYLNDKALAESLLELYTLHKPHGKMKLKAKLLQKGIPEDIISLQMEKFDPAMERETALTAARRFLIKNEPDQQKLARFLARKGFSQEVIEGTVWALLQS